jgi:hypothetical protein
MMFLSNENKFFRNRIYKTVPLTKKINPQIQLGNLAMYFYWPGYRDRDIYLKALPSQSNKIIELIKMIWQTIRKFS